MIAKLLTIVIAIIALPIVAPAQADLPTRGKPLKKSHDEAALLVGKTIGYAHHGEGILYYVSFHKDGKAEWLGKKNQSVPRVYEPTGKPRQFALWSAERPDFGKTIITVGPKGKTAQVIVHTGKITEGTIENTKQLETAGVIQARINALKAEIKTLKTERAEAKADAKSAVQAAKLLVGNSVAYPHKGEAGGLFYISFQKNGEAQWRGKRNQSVPRKYKPTGNPREFVIWWEARPDLGKTLLTVGPDGKTAEVVLPDATKIAGVIEKTR